MTTILLIDNQLYRVKMKETLPQGTVYAVQTMDTYNELQNKSNYPSLRTVAVRNQIYTMKREGDGYIFRCTQSPYPDNSGTGCGANGHFTTAGACIDAFLRTFHDDGYKMMCGQVELILDEKIIDLNAVIDLNSTDHG